MSFLTTERLSLRRMNDDDKDFIHLLLNTPGYLKFIGDNKVRTIEHAKAYLVNGPKTSYQQFGFGYYVVELKKTGEAIGMCGLAKREFLPFADIGYAYFPRYWGKGYAKEAAKAVFEYGYNTLGINRIMGVVHPENPGSQHVLASLGLRYIRDIWLPDEEHKIQLMG
ncbi:MAG: GNAT family N-acetyltransferase [Parashewanella sp.]